MISNSCSTYKGQKAKVAYYAGTMRLEGDNHEKDIINRAVPGSWSIKESDQKVTGYKTWKTG